MDWVRCRAALWVPLAVLLGLALRSYHFLRCPVVWHDEAALVLNVIGLSYSEMFGPLLHAEAAPPLFLIAERVMVSAFGDGIFALRTLPFLASCLSLILFAMLARRMLAPLYAALAVGLFAVSDRLLWHSFEAKPYAVDVLVAVVAAYWFVRTESWALWQRCLPVVFFAPAAIWVSFPACFVLGGLIVGLVASANRASWGGRAAFALMVASVGASFLALALGPVSAQQCEEMERCWTSQFPNWSNPGFVPVWATLQTLELARYCLHPLGQVLVAFSLAGAVALWRRPDSREIFAMLLVPVGLALVAAFLHKYPYGGSRVAVFATPAMCLLVAIGASCALPAIAQRSRALAVVCSLLLLPPFMLTVYRLVEFWPGAATDEAAAYIVEHCQPGELIFGNFWEHEYYLRHEATYRPWQGEFKLKELSARRAWVIHTTDCAVEQYPFPLPAGWEVVCRIPFNRTSVFELHRR
jgi:hypothetical protein